MVCWFFAFWVAMRKHALFFAPLVFSAVLASAAALPPSGMPWKEGALVADGWTMSLQTSLQTYRYALSAGTGATDGMTGPHALFLTAEKAAQLRYLERHVSLLEWRGKRLRAALRLKNQDGAQGYANFRVTTESGESILPKENPMRASARQNAWQDGQVVLDIPADARDLSVHVSLFGPGTVWIDPLVLQAAPDARADAVRRVPPPPGGTDASPSKPVPPGPGAIGVGGDWQARSGFLGAAVSLEPGTPRIRLVQGVAEGGAASLRGDAMVPVDTPGLEPQWAFRNYGGLEKDISLEAWRGKRVRLTLRTQNQDEARAYVLAQVNRARGDGARTLAQRNAPGSGGWETHQFVMDVPGDGNHLYVYAGMTGKGGMLVEGLTLEAVDRGVPLSPVQPVPAGGPISDIYGDAAARCGNAACGLGSDHY